MSVFFLASIVALVYFYRMYNDGGVFDAPEEKTAAEPVVAPVAQEHVAEPVSNFSPNEHDEVIQQVAAFPDTPLETLSTWQRQKLTGSYYAHTRRRVKERYAQELSFATWRAWNDAIKHNSPDALLLKSEQGHVFYRMWLNFRVIYVVYKNDMVVTALTDRGQFHNLVAAAIRQRALEYPDSLLLNKKNEKYVLMRDTKLPPKHKRPKRDENALAKIRAEALGLHDESD